MAATSAASAVPALAAAAWPMRAAEEDRSLGVFEELCAAASAAGAGAELRAALAAARDDERAHRDLCAAVGVQLGAAAPVLDRRPLVARLAALPEAPLQRALALLLVEVAVGETLSCALFAANLRGTREPRAKAALEQILRDEARHAQLGWRGLAELLQLAGHGERAALREELRRSLGAIEQGQARPALERLERGEPFDPALAAHGVLSPEARVEAFYQALEERVLPRLDALGLDGTAAWRARYGAPGAAQSPAHSLK